MLCHHVSDRFLRVLIALDKHRETNIVVSEDLTLILAKGFIPDSKCVLKDGSNPAHEHCYTEKR